MQRLQACKYERMPNGEQRRAVRRFAGSCRVVFNEALGLQQAWHETGEKISKNHVFVCIEDLQVRNMSRSASGTKDTPGKRVRAKLGQNKSIFDQGWLEFRRQLDDKLAWDGGWLIVALPYNASRTCPECGHVSAENRQTQSRFACVECGFEANADVVGAINILARGHRVAACGETAQSGRSKQEPAEAIQS